MSIIKKNNKSFLKWAGGKYNIIDKLSQHFPPGNTFIEPFVGSGSISLNVNYSKCIINDINTDLIYVWKYLKKYKNKFIDDCEKLFAEGINSYNKLRTEFNTIQDTYKKAILFIYLNRHCFNGLCRYNKSGKFNVPVGKYDNPYFPRHELEQCVKKLHKFYIYNKDFSKIFELAKLNDVIYCDPPYLPISKTSSFTNYSGNGFSIKDHERLAKCAYDISKKGVTVIISNSDTELSKKIYKGDYIEYIETKRTISSKINQRQKAKEIIVIWNKK